MIFRKTCDLKLEDCFLFAIDSPKDAARRFNINTTELLRLSEDAKNFRLFSLKETGKKPRKIQEPKPKLQSIHRRIARLLARVEAPTYLHSAVRGRSYVTNANAHAARHAVLKIDVKDFFCSVSRASVFNFFVEQLKCRRDSAGIISDLLTFERHLATGSSSSPIISYYSFRPLFDEIESFAARNDLVMTCYVDDLTLSGTNATREMLWQLRKIITRFGLRSHKAHFLTMRKPRIITGVCITDQGARVPYALKRKIASSRRLANAAPNEKLRQRAARELIGRLDAAGQIEPAFRTRAQQARVKYADLLQTAS